MLEEWAKFCWIVKSLRHAGIKPEHGVTDKPPVSSLTGIAQTLGDAVDGEMYHFQNHLVFRR